MNGLRKLPVILSLMTMLSAASASAGFDSLYIFGDSISCTASNPSPGSLFYGRRYTNGRVWVEVLAQMLGITNFNPSFNTNSFYANTSPNLFNQTTSYPPASASNSLVVVWVNNADFVDPTVNDDPNTGAWLTLINVATNSHYKALTNLYFSKSIRYLVAPNVVDIPTVPFANLISVSKKAYVRQMCTNYNIAFSNMLNRVQATCTNLVIYRPDFNTLLSSILANQAAYGTANVYTDGVWMAATTASAYYPNLPVAKTNGYGTNYVFWDETDPTAKVHSIMASEAHKLITQVRITLSNTPALYPGSNQLLIVNAPVYTNVPLNAVVLSCTNLASGIWITNTRFTPTNTAQTIWVTNTGSQSFYQVKFPYTWSYP